VTDVSSDTFTDLPLVWHLPNVRAAFIPPMLLLRREKLPEGPEWRFEQTENPSGSFDNPFDLNTEFNLVSVNRLNEKAPHLGRFSNS
jgi:hypothetical protein